MLIFIIFYLHIRFTYQRYVPSNEYLLVPFCNKMPSEFSLSMKL